MLIDFHKMEFAIFWRQQISDILHQDIQMKLFWFSILALHLLMGHGNKHWNLQTEITYARFLFPHSSELAKGRTKFLNCKCQHCKHICLFFSTKHCPITRIRAKDKQEQSHVEQKPITHWLLVQLMNNF